MDCIFCKIAAKEIGSEMIYEDEHVVAFLDIHPMTPGHTVVIPKVHAENIIGLPESEVAPLFEAVKKITALLQGKLNPRGFTIGINHGTDQGVDHIHVHVVPRYVGDGGGSIHSIVKYSLGEPLSAIRDRIVG
jgi:histidine triad (HIT) family protein